MAEATSSGDKGGLLCPSCRIDLVMSERQGIEIDYCPKCRGVWLDRGELDKIIERSAIEDSRATSPPPSSQPTSPAQAPSSDYYEGRHGSGHGSRGYGSARGRGHGSFLGRLFD